jgi:hypothetical protein
MMGWVRICVAGVLFRDVYYVIIKMMLLFSFVRNLRLSAIPYTGDLSLQSLNTKAYPRFLYYIPFS